MKIIEFNIAAILLLSVILLSTYVKGFTKGKANKAFIIMNIQFLITTVVGTISAALDNSGAGLVDAKFIAHGTYLFLHNMSAMFFMVFIIILSDKMYSVRKSLLKKILIFAPWSIVCILLLINCFRPTIYIINENGVYTRLPAFILLYVLSVLYLLYSIVHIIKFRTLFNSKWKVSLFGFYPLVGIAMTIEYLYPLVIIEPLANAIAFLFIGYGVMHPEDYFDTDTGYNSKYAYYEECHKILFNKRPMMEIHINIINFDSVTEILDYDEGRRLTRKTADIIYNCALEEEARCALYNLGYGSYSLHFDDSQFDKVGKIAENINNILKGNMTLGAFGVTLDACVCVIHIPEDVRTFDELIAIGENFAQEKYVDDVFYANKLLQDQYFRQLINLDRIIEKAFNESRISVVYQPIYSLKEKRFVCAEALARLKDDEYGYISPSLFIPRAEKTGAINKIGDCILEQVSRFVASDEFKALGLDFVDVNLSAVQCMQYNLAEHIDRYVSQYGVPRNKIVLEITETAASISQDIFIRNIDELRKAGFTISLDDFGVGYSNIKRLSDIPFNIIKLDKSLADIIENDDSEKKQLVDSITRLVISLGYKTVIEGVESEKTLKVFEELGCDYVQGYVFSKPLSESDFVSFISIGAGKDI